MKYEVSLILVLEIKKLWNLLFSAAFMFPKSQNFEIL